MPVSHSLTPADLSLLRSLDASFDRLTEALRTVEDQLRFGESLSALPGRFKALRHRASEIARAVEQRADAPLPSFRDPDSDAGHPDTSTEPAYGSSPTRHGPADLLRANLARARESARSIEEALRAFRHAPRELIQSAESLRYAVYADEARVVGHGRRSGRLEEVRLYALLTTDLCAGDPCEVARAALRGGVQMIQLREKTLPRRRFLALARDLREITAAEGALFIVNDAIDIARLCAADGVHQGQEDLPPAEARKVLGPDAIVGVSTHSPAQAQRAEADGADYIGVGPIFETQTKEHRAAVGLDFVREAALVTSIPGFAIGSVNTSTIDAVIAAGARRVAICTGIIAADEVEAAATRFRERLDTVWSNSTRPAEEA